MAATRQTCTTGRDRPALPERDRGASSLCRTVSCRPSSSWRRRSLGSRTSIPWSTPCPSACSTRLWRPRATAEERYAGKHGGPRPLEGLPVAVKDEVEVAGQPCTEGSLIFKDEIARGHSGQRAAHHRRGRHHPRPLGDSRVLLRGDHRVAPVGDHPQPLEHGLQSRRLLGRLGRRPGGRHGEPRDRLRHRRLDPHPGLVLRRRRVQAALRARAPDAALQPRPLLPRGPMARTVDDCRLLENVMAGPHPEDIVSLRPKLTIPDALPPSPAGRSPAASTWAASPSATRSRAAVRAAAETFRAPGRDGRRGRARLVARRHARGRACPPRRHLRQLDRHRRRGAPRPADAVRAGLRRRCRCGIRRSAGCSPWRSRARPTITSPRSSSATTRSSARPSPSRHCRPAATTTSTRSSPTP